MVSQQNIQKEKNTTPTSLAYKQLVEDAASRVRSGQLAVFKAVNKELIELYWDLVKMIHECQQENSWGKSVVELLAKDFAKRISYFRWLISQKSMANENFLLVL